MAWLRRLMCLVPGLLAVSLMAACGSDQESSSGDPDDTSSAPLADAVPESWQGRDIQFGQHIYPAWTEADTSGKINGGVLYDLGTEIAGHSGLTVSQQSGDLDSFIASLQSGRMDIVGVTGSTVEREATYDIIGFYADGPGVLTPNSDDFAPAELLDLCGHQIAVISGGTQSTQIPVVDELCVAAGQPKTETLQLPEADAAILAVQSGRVEGFFTSRSATEATAHANDDFAARTLSDAETLPGGKVYDGIMVRKGGGEAEFLLQVVEDLFESGRLAEILQDNGLSAPAESDIGINLATAMGGS